MSLETDNKTILSLYLSGLVSIPIILVSLPATFFDHGKSLCLSVLLLNKECPGCGMTRACQHAIHFQFESAWGFNKLVLIILPVLVFIWFREVIRVTRKLRKIKAS